MQSLFSNGQLKLHSSYFCQWVASEETTSARPAQTVHGRQICSCIWASWQEKQNSCDNFNWCAICKSAHVISNEMKMNVEVHSLLNASKYNNERWRNCSAISAAISTLITHFGLFVLSTTHLNRATRSQWAKPLLVRVSKHCLHEQAAKAACLSICAALRAEEAMNVDWLMLPNAHQGTNRQSACGYSFWSWIHSHPFCMILLYSVSKEENNPKSALAPCEGLHNLQSVKICSSGAENYHKFQLDC